MTNPDYHCIQVIEIGLLRLLGALWTVTIGTSNHSVNMEVNKQMEVLENRELERSFRKNFYSYTITQNHFPNKQTVKDDPMTWNWNGLGRMYLGLTLEY
ncbi:unnamed protein product, partial [Nesidiocoris tenuis]